MKIKSDKQIQKHILRLAVLCVLLFCLSVKVHAESEYEITELQMQGTITTDSALNVRSGPGKEYDVIDLVKKDIVLTITGQTDNGWYQVELDGKTGYVSGQYVKAEELPEEETIGEPEEGYRGLKQSPYIIKIAVIGAVILIILIMLTFTLKGMRKDDSYDEEDEDEEYEDEDEEEDDIDGEGSDSYDDEGDAVERAVRKETRERIKKREYIIREEDYRVEIDPRFFEEKDPIEQPDMVTGYLERKKIEEAIGASEFPQIADTENAECQNDGSDKQKELDMAMEKLNELQKEIERLKNEN